jgi:hypothetical protein
MLKIKESVDLKELEKFIKKQKYKEIGIWKRYNINTGELETVWVGFQWKTGGHSYMISYELSDRIIDSAGGVNLDLLYDLIKADMVEKVEE